MRVLIALLLTATLAGCLTETPAAQDPVVPPAPVPLVPVWGDLEAPIRPGASLGGYCTFNFLFYDNTTGHAYIGTAAHCTDAVDERLTLPGVGEIATVVFDSDLTKRFPDADPAVDFTLALLDPERVPEANPQMLGWEGPRGHITAAELAVGDEVQLHGYGVLLGQNDATRDRFGVVVDWDDKLYRADMPAVNGDSGSPLLHGPTGHAFGIISHYGFGVPPATDEGPLMSFVMDQIHANGFPHVQLATIG